MLKLAWPWLLASAPLPLLVAWLAPRGRRAAGASIRVPFFDAVGQAAHTRRAKRLGFRLAFAVLAWLSLVVASARPQWVDDPLALPVSGRDLVLAVDISGSMKRKDLRLEGVPRSRLEVVKRVAGGFIERRAGDRIGLILFGTRAYVQAPLTFDRETVHTLLDEALIGLAGELTAIGDAMGLAVKRLRERPQENRVLVLLTDGTNTAGAVGPLEAAELAATQGLKIYTIGVGDERSNLAQDLDEETLREIARIGGGQYFRARATDELEAIYARLDELEPVSDDSEKFYPTYDLFYWPLSVALALSMLLLASACAGRTDARDRLRHTLEAKAVS